MKGSSQHQFSMVPSAQIPRSQFNRSHGYKTTFDADYLVPIYIDEALPGDTVNLRMSAFARLATPIVPIMDNLYMDTFFFAVPYRLVWENWEKFNGAQTNPGDSTTFLIPQMVSTAVTGYAENSIHDYMGLPTKIPGITHTALWHRAYNLIWNEWFRDQNLQTSLTVDIGDAASLPANYVLKKRGKRHDYFTSALPWPQKGAAVSIPLGTSAPVVGDGTNAIKMYSSATGGDRTLRIDTDRRNIVDGGAPATQQDAKFSTTQTGLIANLSSATASTINTLRQAFQLQRLYERDARGGTRYTEILKSHFQVVSPDFRLQRPEVLGTGSQMVNIHPIAQTSKTDGTAALGSLAAMGTVGIHGHGFTKSFTEHCLLIGLVNVRCDLNYQQNLDKKWSRLTRFDHYWPALSHIGEQAILTKELFCQGTAVDTGATGTPDNEKIFGYQERYAEYRYFPSKITGQFKSNCTAPIDYWHLAQNITALPTLGDTFITSATPMTRVLAVNTQPHFIFDAHFSIKAARPMPTYSVPGMMDHF